MTTRAERIEAALLGLTNVVSWLPDAAKYPDARRAYEKARAALASPHDAPEPEKGGEPDWPEALALELANMVSLNLPDGFPISETARRFLAIIMRHAPASSVADPQAPAPSGARCAKTGNPVGTDTWAIGYECPCRPCQVYLRGEASVAASEAPDHPFVPHPAILLACWCDGVQCHHPGCGLLASAHPPADQKECRCTGCLWPPDYYTKWSDRSEPRYCPYCRCVPNHPPYKPPADQGEREKRKTNWRVGEWIKPAVEEADDE